MRKTKTTRELVNDWLDTYCAHGEPVPSQRTLRREIGKGSFTQIKDGIDAWVEKNRSSGHKSRHAFNFDEMVIAVTRLIRVYVDECVTREGDRRVAELTDTLEELQDQISRQNEAMNELKSSLAFMTAKLKFNKINLNELPNPPDDWFQRHEANTPKPRQR